MWKPPLRPYHPALVALLTGLILSFAAMAAVRRWEERRESARIDDQVARAADMLTHGLDEHAELLVSIDQLRPLAGARDAEGVSAEAQSVFRRFVRSNAARRPGYLGFVWTPRLTAADRPAFESALKALDPTSAGIVDVDDAGVRPAAKRPEYFPATFSEPIATITVPVGLDQWSVPARRVALTFAQERNAVAASPPHPLLEAPGRPNGIILVLPIRVPPGEARPFPHEIPPTGFVIGLVDARALVQDAAAAANNPWLRWQLEDVTDAGQVALIATRTASEAGTQQGRFHRDWALERPAYGRRWRLIAQSVQPSPPLGLSAAPLFTLAAGSVISLLATAYLAMSARRAAQLALAAAELGRREARFRSLVQNGSDLMAVLDRQGMVTYVSPSVRRLLGYEPEDVTGSNAFGFLHPEDASAMSAGFQRMVERPEARPFSQFRIRHADGTWRFMEATATNLLADPSVEGIVENMRDVTERQALEGELLRQAFEDSLTGLANRARFMERLNFRLVTEAEHGLAVLFFDLDSFKVINDTLGHEAGDSLLCALADRLRTAAGAGETVSRFGGDEFALLYAAVPEAALALERAHELIVLLGEPVRLVERVVTPSVSIGVAWKPADVDVDAGELLRRADLALYEAKAAGKGQAKLFDVAMDARARERLDLETRLRDAINADGLSLAYQPEVDPETGTIVGMEALARWRHPLRGPISPAEFIPIAEDTGLILPLGEWVLRSACRQYRLWSVMCGTATMPQLSVNVSTRQLLDPAFAGVVREVLNVAEMPPWALRLEITESALIEEGPVVQRTLRALTDLGVHLALDDFGTGYASLTYLQQLPVQTVKIDRSFVIGHDDRARAIVRTVTALAHSLHMNVTAEGVETDAQLATVTSAGCDRVQGYYFSPPISAEAMTDLLCSPVRARAA